jgi:hypothetical protein
MSKINLDAKVGLAPSSLPVPSLPFLLLPKEGEGQQQYQPQHALG